MFKKSLLLMLLMALFMPWAANAQTPLFSEDFEDGSMPTGWTTDGSGTWSVATGDYSASTGAGHGTYNAKITHNTTGNVTKLITPEIDLSGITSAELSFMHIQRSWAGDIDQLRVYYRTSSSGTWTQILEYTAAIASWTTEEQVILPNLSSTYQLAFEHTDKYGYGVGLDNIVIVQGAATPKPTNLAVNGITENSATLNWTENGTATSWQICVNDNEANLITTSTKPYTLTGLTAQTAYTVKVRSVGSPNSDWSNSLTFNTSAVAVAVGDSWSDDFEGASCSWELINGTCADAWVWGTAINNGGTHALYISDDGGTSCNYSHNSVKVFATKLLSFTEGKFTFSYDWKCYGESSYDFLRVALVPASQTLTAGSDYGTITTTSLPTGWIALDGGGKLNQVQEWQNKEVAVNVTAGNYYLVLAWRSDTSTQNQPPAAVDNVSITKMACGYDVEGLAVTEGSITTTGAAITWTAGEATQWQVAYKKAADSNWTELTPISNNAYTFTNLDPATNYQVKVRAYCGGEDYGAWCNPVSFATECVVIPALGYTENFDSYTASSGFLPLCWSRINTSSSTYYNYYPYVYNYNANSASNCLYFYTYGSETSTNISDQYAVLPEMSGLDGKQITLFAKRGSNEVSFTIGLMEDPTDVSTFHEIATQALTTTYTEYVFTLSGTGNYVAIMLPKPTSSTSQYYYVYIDDISIAEPPTCPKPKNLTVSNITNHTAELSWTETGEATEWIISLNEKELDDPATENPFVLTELDPETEYTVKVRASCGNDDYSDWSNEVTFTTDIACPAPTNVAVSDITATSATVSWTGLGESYNLRYRAKTADEYATITFAPNDVWQDGTGYQLLLDADATAYGTIIPESGGLTTGGNATAATYAAFEYKIPENADGAMNTTNVLIGESVTILIPAGTYDWCVTNPTPGDRIWIAGDGRGDDLVIEGGKTYLFVVQSNGEGGDEVVITDSGTATTVTANWTEINGVTSPYTITVEAEKDYIVEVQADCDADGTSAWASANFTTPSNCQVPTPLDVTDITAYTATLNWTGVQDSYQVQYRTKGSRELLFFEDFDNQPSTWTLTNASYDRTSSQTTDYFVYLGYGYTETAYLITPELTINGAGTVEFKHRSYNGDATFQVGFSSTTNDVDAFTWGQEVSAAGVFFEAYSVAMPSGTKYVAIKSTTSTDDIAVFINEFGIYGNEIPAGDWTTSTVNNATSCDIIGLSGNKEYEWHVRGVNSSCDGGYTEWSTMATFETEPSCIAPTNLTISSVTTESAVISWTSDAASFDIDVNGVVTEGVTSPYTLENLEAKTEYTVKVRTNCGEGDYSDWTTESFMTPCTSFDLPYLYGFDDLAGAETDMDCWIAGSGNTGNSIGAIWRDQENGDIALRFSSFNQLGSGSWYQYLISPELNTEEAVQVEFEYKASSTYGTETFMVGYSSTLDLNEFVWEDEVSADFTDDFQTYTTTFPAGTKYVAVLYTSEYQYYLYVDNFKFEEVTSGVTQTINFPNTGRSSFWFSTYIEMEPVALLEAIEDALGGNGIEIKYKNSVTSWDEDDEEWGGGLQNVGITNDKTYMIKTNAAATVTLEGPASNPADYEISLTPEGWTWIGFPCGVEVDIDDALSTFVPLEGDQIKSKNAVSSWDPDEELWDGSLTKLVPGTGYMFYSAGTTTRTLIFSTGSTKGRGVNTMGQKTIINKTMGNQVIKHVSLIDKEKTQNNEKQNDQTRQMFKHK